MLSTLKDYSGIIFIYFSILLTVFLFYSCSKVYTGLEIVDTATHVLHIENKATKVIYMANELHKAGVDKEVIESIHHLIHKAHEIAEEHANENDIKTD